LTAVVFNPKYEWSCKVKNRKEVLQVLLSEIESRRQKKNGDSLLGLKLKSQSCGLRTKDQRGWTCENTNVLDVVSKGGQTALMKAVQKNDPEMVQMLIDAGATVDLAVHDGKF